MRAFKQLQAVVAPLDRANVDTDAILAKQFMKSIRRSGYGDYLFDAWRYLDQGELGMEIGKRPRNPAFVLNQPQYAGAQILLARENFGCGSSREHAAWALWDYGIRALLAPSFADIFHGNCFKNGMLPVTLSSDRIDELFALAASPGGLVLKVDLERQCVLLPDGRAWCFEIDPQRRHRLLQGLDDIELTLGKAERIRAYEVQRRAAEPWLFDTGV